MSEIREGDLIDFGETPPEVNELLQQGVMLHRQDRTAAEAKFREALALDPSTLATYFCLYKILAYQGLLDDALPTAEAGLLEAVRQAGLPGDFILWTPENLAKAEKDAARFALYALKAIAFIHLRRGKPEETRRRLDKLAELGEIDGLGGGVVDDLMRAVA
jgi:tetratricopeptide (TPR) repeat protein